MAEALLVTPPKMGPVIPPIQNNIYGIRISNSVSDPSSRVTYTGDATKLNPLVVNSGGSCDYGGWKDIINDVIGCKPCLYQNGKRVKYLNPNNYSQDVNGGSVDITSGNAGDVMIEFKETFYRWRNSGGDTIFEITGKDMSSDSSWCSTAFHKKNGVRTGYMYYSAYEGFINGGKLRSLSGKTPTVNQTIGQFRNAAVANGENYQQEEIAKRMYIIGLLFLVSKSTNAQAAFGYGWVSGNSGPATTGTCNGRGLFYGTSSKNQVAKVFGIENFWGSLYHWCDGYVSGGGNVLRYKEYGPYNDAGSGYPTVSGFSNGSGCCKSLKAVGNGMVYADQIEGSYDQYYCDHCYLASGAGCVCRVGGDWSDGLNAGPLYCGVCYSASDAYSNFGGRLCAA